MSPGTRSFRTLSAVVLALGLALTACTGDDGGNDDGPSAEPSTSESTPAEPTLADTYYPEQPEGERVTVGDEQYADPCHLLPPADVHRLFPSAVESGVGQTMAVRSMTEPQGEFECWYKDLALTVSYTSGPGAARHDTRWRARQIEKGLWFYLHRTGADFEDVIGQLGGADAGQANYRVQDGRIVVELGVDVPAGQPEDGFHGAARDAFAVIRKNLAQRANLSQERLGPVLRGEPLVRDTPIADACALLSDKVVEGLTGSAAHDAVLVNSTTDWTHEDGTHPDPGKWASPYTECERTTGNDDETDAPGDHTVRLMVRSHPRLREAKRSFRVGITRVGLPEQALTPPAALDLAADQGGWFATQGSRSTSLHLRIGLYTVELDITPGGGAPDHPLDATEEPVAALVDQLRGLSA